MQPIETIYIIKVPQKDCKPKVWGICYSLEETQESMNICSKYYSFVYNDKYVFYSHGVEIHSLLNPRIQFIDFHDTIIYDQDCQYGYHKHLTFAYGDGWFDTWTCDKCGEEAICTGELINHGVDEASKRLLKIAQTGEKHNYGGKILNECAKEILNLHDIINKYVKIAVDLKRENIILKEQLTANGFDYARKEGEK